MWRGHDRAEVAARAERELRSLRDYLAAKDEILSDHGNVLVASLVSVAVGADESAEQTRIRVCRVPGRLLAAEEERTLSAIDAFAADEPPHPAECADAAGRSHPAPASRIPAEFGRASRRERVCRHRYICLDAASYKKKKTT